MTAQRKPLGWTTTCKLRTPYYHVELTLHEQETGNYSVTTYAYDIFWDEDVRETETFKNREDAMKYLLEQQQYITESISEKLEEEDK